MNRMSQPTGVQGARRRAGTEASLGRSFSNFRCHEDGSQSVRFDFTSPNTLGKPSSPSLQQRQPMVRLGASATPASRCSRR